MMLILTLKFLQPFVVLEAGVLKKEEAAHDDIRRVMDYEWN